MPTRSKRRSRGVVVAESQSQPHGALAHYYKIASSDKRLMLAIILGVMLGGLQVVPFVASMMHPDQLHGYTIPKYEEIVIRRDSKTNRYGFTYSDDLTIKEVDPHSTGHEAGLTSFIGRRVQKVNGVRVASVAEFHNAIIKRDQRSSLSYHIVLHFTPVFTVGTAVRATKRLSFKYNTVQQGTVGVILRASMDGKSCTARIGGVIFEGTYNQVEVVVDEDVPHKYSEEPSWLIKVDGEKYLRDIINELNYGQMGYYEKLVAYGIDRPDLMALATPQDAEELMIKPHHFHEMLMTCKKIIRERKRRYHHRLAEDVATGDLTLLAELQTEARKRVLLNAARELEGKPALPFPKEVEPLRLAIADGDNATLSLNDTAVAIGSNETALNLTAMPV